MSTPILFDNNLHKLVLNLFIGVEVDELESIFSFDEDVVFFPWISIEINVLDWTLDVHLYFHFEIFGG